MPHGQDDGRDAGLADQPADAPLEAHGFLLGVDFALGEDVHPPVVGGRMRSKSKSRYYWRLWPRAEARGPQGPNGPAVLTRWKSHKTRSNSVQKRANSSLNLFFYSVRIGDNRHNSLSLVTTRLKLSKTW